MEGNFRGGLREYSVGSPHSLVVYFHGIPIHAPHLIKLSIDFWLDQSTLTTCLFPGSTSCLWRSLKGPGNPRHFLAGQYRLGSLWGPDELGPKTIWFVWLSGILWDLPKCFRGPLRTSGHWLGWGLLGLEGACSQSNEKQVYRFLSITSASSLLLEGITLQNLVHRPRGIAAKAQPFVAHKCTRQTVF